MRLAWLVPRGLLFTFVFLCVFNMLRQLCLVLGGMKYVAICAVDIDSVVFQYWTLFQSVVWEVDDGHLF